MGGLGENLWNDREAREKDMEQESERETKERKRWNERDKREIIEVIQGRLTEPLPAACVPVSAYAYYSLAAFGNAQLTWTDYAREDRESQMMTPHAMRSTVKPEFLCCSNSMVPPACIVFLLFLSEECGSYKGHTGTRYKAPSPLRAGPLTMGAVFLVRSWVSLDDLNQILLSNRGERYTCSRCALKSVVNRLRRRNYADDSLQQTVSKMAAYSRRKNMAAYSRRHQRWRGRTNMIDALTTEEVIGWRTLVVTNDITDTSTPGVSFINLNEGTSNIHDGNEECDRERAAPECKSGKNGRSPRNSAKLAASFGTIPTCENPGVARPDIEPVRLGTPLQVPTLRKHRAPVQRPVRSNAVLIAPAISSLPQARERFQVGGVLERVRKFGRLLTARGAAVVERLEPARLPPRRLGSNPRPGHALIFTSGNRTGRCHWSAGFLGDLPFAPSLAFRRCSIVTSFHQLLTAGS
ncbi:hypothetical protein PR048_014861 [Dryococelus australis]|uniref:Uncharacterized protein n=1 Tax=Dryococelus australis TaxID=614101 RepID=A0ABQ9HFC5_9NEOP|nr:hypothetical protein PR048_014861 [Dryococelus australis]